MIDRFIQTKKNITRVLISFQGVVGKTGYKAKTTTDVLCSALPQNLIFVPALVAQHCVLNSARQELSGIDRLVRTVQSPPSAMLEDLGFVYSLAIGRSDVFLPAFPLVPSIQDTNQG